MIELSKETKQEVISKIKRYFQQELDQEIGGFDAEFLLDFFTKEIGGHFYNQALADVHLLLEKHMESMTDTVLLLEKTVPSP